MRVAVDELEALVTERLLGAGVPEEHSDLVARSLVDADQRGVSSHGTARLPMYLEAIENGTIDGASLPSTSRASDGASLWDGNRSLGQVAATRLMRHAVDKARAIGAHVAVCHNTNHFGAAAYWARLAADEGCLGMAFTTAHPLVVPTGGTRAELGTNPISLAFNGSSEEYVLDMATSAVALGKVEVRLREGEPIPDGWAVDAEGRPVNDPAAVYPDVLHGRVGGLLPLGGASETSGGHKGYGLGAMVEILCAVLGGGGDLTPGRPLEERRAGLWRVSHCYIVIDPEHLAGRQQTGAALDSMVTALRESPPSDPASPVIVHGDKERKRTEAQQHELEINDLVWRELTA
jgi:LDH2 family malate/lactate/ureidoglycolate dehydrogenase